MDDSRSQAEQQQAAGRQVQQQQSAGQRYQAAKRIAKDLYVRDKEKSAALAAQAREMDMLRQLLLQKEQENASLRSAVGTGQPESSQFIRGNTPVDIHRLVEDAAASSSSPTAEGNAIATARAARTLRKSVSTKKRELVLEQRKLDQIMCKRSLAIANSTRRTIERVQQAQLVAATGAHELPQQTSAPQSTAAAPRAPSAGRFTRRSISLADASRSRSRGRARHAQHMQHELREGPAAPGLITRQLSVHAAGPAAGLQGPATAPDMTHSSRSATARQAACHANSPFAAVPHSAPFAPPAASGPQQRIDSLTHAATDRRVSYGSQRAGQPHQHAAHSVSSREPSLSGTSSRPPRLTTVSSVYTAASGPEQRRSSGGGNNGGNAGTGGGKTRLGTKLRAFFNLKPPQSSKPARQKQHPGDVTPGYEGPGLPYRPPSSPSISTQATTLPRQPSSTVGPSGPSGSRPVAGLLPSQHSGSTTASMPTQPEIGPLSRNLQRLRAERSGTSEAPSVRPRSDYGSEAFTAPWPCHDVSNESYRQPAGYSIPGVGPLLEGQQQPAAVFTTRPAPQAERWQQLHKELFKEDMPNASVPYQQVVLPMPDSRHTSAASTPEVAASTPKVTSLGGGKPPVAPVSAAVAAAGTQPSSAGALRLPTQNTTFSFVTADAGHTVQAPVAMHTSTATTHRRTDSAASTPATAVGHSGMAYEPLTSLMQVRTSRGSRYQHPCAGGSSTAQHTRVFDSQMLIAVARAVVGQEPGSNHGHSPRGPGSGVHVPGSSREGSAAPSSCAGSHLSDNPRLDAILGQLRNFGHHNSPKAPPVVLQAEENQPSYILPAWTPGAPTSPNQPALTAQPSATSSGLHAPQPSQQVQQQQAQAAATVVPGEAQQGALLEKGLSQRLSTSPSQGTSIRQARRHMDGVVLVSQAGSLDNMEMPTEGLNASLMHQFVQTRLLDEQMLAAKSPMPTVRGTANTGAEGSGNAVDARKIEALDSLVNFDRTLNLSMLQPGAAATWAAQLAAAVTPSPHTSLHSAMDVSHGGMTGYGAAQADASESVQVSAAGFHTPADGCTSSMETNGPPAVDCDMLRMSACASNVTAAAARTSKSASAAQAVQHGRKQQESRECASSTSSNGSNGFRKSGAEQAECSSTKPAGAQAHNSREVQHAEGHQSTQQFLYAEQQGPVETSAPEMQGCGQQASASHAVLLAAARIASHTGSSSSSSRCSSNSESGTSPTSVSEADAHADTAAVEPRNRLNAQVLAAAAAASPAQSGISSHACDIDEDDLDDDATNAAVLPDAATDDGLGSPAAPCSPCHINASREGLYRELEAPYSPSRLHSSHHSYHPDVTASQQMSPGSCCTPRDMGGLTASRSMLSVAVASRGKTNESTDSATTGGTDVTKQELRQQLHTGGYRAMFAQSLRELHTPDSARTCHPALQEQAPYSEGSSPVGPINPQGLFTTSSCPPGIAHPYFGTGSPAPGSNTHSTMRPLDMHSPRSPGASVNHVGTSRFSPRPIPAVPGCGWASPSTQHPAHSSLDRSPAMSQASPNSQAYSGHKHSAGHTVCSYGPQHSQGSVALQHVQGDGSPGQSSVLQNCALQKCTVAAAPDTSGPTLTAAAAAASSPPSSGTDGCVASSADAPCFASPQPSRATRSMSMPMHHSTNATNPLALNVPGVSPTLRSPMAPSSTQHGVLQRSPQPTMLNSAGRPYSRSFSNATQHSSPVPMQTHSKTAGGSYMAVPHSSNVGPMLPVGVPGVSAHAMPIQASARQQELCSSTPHHSNVYQHPMHSPCSPQQEQQLQAPGSSCMDDAEWQPSIQQPEQQQLQSSTAESPRAGADALMQAEASGASLQQQASVHDLRQAASDEDKDCSQQQSDSDCGSTPRSQSVEHQQPMQEEATRCDASESQVPCPQLSDDHLQTTQDLASSSPAGNRHVPSLHLPDDLDASSVGTENSQEALQQGQDQDACSIASSQGNKAQYSDERQCTADSSVSEATCDSPAAIPPTPHVDATGRSAHMAVLEQLADDALTKDGSQSTCSTADSSDAAHKDDLEDAVSSQTVQHTAQDSAASSTQAEAATGAMIASRSRVSSPIAVGHSVEAPAGHAASSHGSDDDNNSDEEEVSDDASSTARSEARLSSAGDAPPAQAHISLPGIMLQLPSTLDEDDAESDGTCSSRDSDAAPIITGGLHALGKVGAEIFTGGLHSHGKVGPEIFVPSSGGGAVSSGGGAASCQMLPPVTPQVQLAAIGVGSHGGSDVPPAAEASETTEHALTAPGSPTASASELAVQPLSEQAVQLASEEEAEEELGTLQQAHLLQTSEQVPGGLAQSHVALSSLMPTCSSSTFTVPSENATAVPDSAMLPTSSSSPCQVAVAQGADAADNVVHRGQWATMGAASAASLCSGPQAVNALRRHTTTTSITVAAPLSSMAATAVRPASMSGGWFGSMLSSFVSTIATPLQQALADLPALPTAQPDAVSPDAQPQPQERCSTVAALQACSPDAQPQPHGGQAVCSPDAGMGSTRRSKAGAVVVIARRSSTIATGPTDQAAVQHSTDGVACRALEWDLTSKQDTAGFALSQGPASLKCSAAGPCDTASAQITAHNLLRRVTAAAADIISRHAPANAILATAMQGDSVMAFGRSQSSTLSPGARCHTSSPGGQYAVNRPICDGVTVLTSSRRASVAADKDAVLDARGVVKASTNGPPASSLHLPHTQSSEHSSSSSEDVECNNGCSQHLPAAFPDLAGLASADSDAADSNAADSDAADRDAPSDTQQPTSPQAQQQQLQGASGPQSGDAFAGSGQDSSTTGSPCSSAAVGPAGCGIALGAMLPDTLCDNISSTASDAERHSAAGNASTAPTDAAAADAADKDARSSASGAVSDKADEDVSNSTSAAGHNSQDEDDAASADSHAVGDTPAPFQGGLRDSTGSSEEAIDANTLSNPHQQQSGDVESIMGQGAMPGTCANFGMDMAELDAQACVAPRARAGRVRARRHRAAAQRAHTMDCRANNSHIIREAMDLQPHPVVPQQPTITQCSGGADADSTDSTGSVVGPERPAMHSGGCTTSSSSEERDMSPRPAHHVRRHPGARDSTGSHEPASSTGHSQCASSGEAVDMHTPTAAQAQTPMPGPAAGHADDLRASTAGTMHAASTGPGGSKQRSGGRRTRTHSSGNGWSDDGYSLSRGGATHVTSAAPLPVPATLQEVEGPEGAAEWSDYGGREATSSSNGTALDSACSQSQTVMTVSGCSAKQTSTKRASTRRRSGVSGQQVKPDDQLWGQEEVTSSRRCSTGSCQQPATQSHDQGNDGDSESGLDPNMLSQLEARYMAAVVLQDMALTTPRGRSTHTPAPGLEFPPGLLADLKLQISESPKTTERRRGRTHRSDRSARAATASEPHAATVHDPYCTGSLPTEEAMANAQGSGAAMNIAAHMGADPMLCDVQASMQCSSSAQACGPLQPGIPHPGACAAGRLTTATATRGAAAAPANVFEAASSEGGLMVFGGQDQDLSDTDAEQGEVATSTTGRHVGMASRLARRLLGGAPFRSVSTKRSPHGVHPTAQSTSPGHMPGTHKAARHGKVKASAAKPVEAAMPGIGRVVASTAAATDFLPAADFQPAPCLPVPAVSNTSQSSVTSAAPPHQQLWQQQQGDSVDSAPTSTGVPHNTAPTAPGSVKGVALTRMTTPLDPNIRAATLYSSLGYGSVAHNEGGMQGAGSDGSSHGSRVRAGGQVHKAPAAVSEQLGPLSRQRVQASLPTIAPIINIPIPASTTTKASLRAKAAENSHGSKQPPVYAASTAQQQYEGSSGGGMPVIVPLSQQHGSHVSSRQAAVTPTRAAASSFSVWAPPADNHQTLEGGVGSPYRGVMAQHQKLQQCAGYVDSEAVASSTDAWESADSEAHTEHSGSHGGFVGGSGGGGGAGSSTCPSTAGWATPPTRPESQAGWTTPPAWADESRAASPNLGGA